VNVIGRIIVVVSDDTVASTDAKLVCSSLVVVQCDFKP